MRNVEVDLAPPARVEAFTLTITVEGESLRYGPPSRTAEVRSCAILPRSGPPTSAQWLSMASRTAAWCASGMTLFLFHRSGPGHRQREGRVLDRLDEVPGPLEPGVAGLDGRDAWLAAPNAVESRRDVAPWLTCRRSRPSSGVDRGRPAHGAAGDEVARRPPGNALGLPLGGVLGEPHRGARISSASAGVASLPPAQARLPGRNVRASPTPPGPPP